jgi:hypothetical protein
MNLIKRLFSKKVQKQCAISGVSNSYSKPDVQGNKGV